MKSSYIIIILLVVVIAFGGAFLYYNISTKPTEITYYNYSPGNEFVTNLKGGNKFVRVVVELQVYNKDVLNDLQKQNSKIRDAIILVLRNKSSDELDGSKGQLKLQSDIKAEINKIVGSDKVTNVFFDDFIVQ